MNTLAHFCAMLSILWLDIEMWTTYDERLLGAAGAALFLLYVALTWFAAESDWQEMFGSGEPGDGDG